jgi:hypothetical protein
MKFSIKKCLDDSGESCSMPLIIKTPKRMEEYFSTCEYVEGAAPMLIYGVGVSTGLQ